MAAKINTIINNANFELIRDQVAYLLKDELDKQAELQENNDLTADIFTERFTPKDGSEGNLITVNLDNMRFDGDTPVSQFNEIHFNIDIFTDAVETSGLEGYKASSLKNQRLCGLIRSIIQNPVYATIGFEPGFIMRRSVQTIRFNRIIDNMDGTFSRMSRIDLMVVCVEEQSQITPIIASGYDTSFKIEQTEKGYKLIKNK